MCRRELGGVGWGFGLATLCQILGPDVGRATRTTFIESFFSLFVEVKTANQNPHGRSPFPWVIGAESKAHFSAHTLGIILSVFSSQQQVDVVCAVNLCGTCCTNFMCGSVKNKSASSHHEAKSKSVFVPFPNEDRQYLCPSPLGLVILPLFFLV